MILLQKNLGRGVVIKFNFGFLSLERVYPGYIPTSIDRDVSVS
jgi:hypothetical protein